MKIALKITPQRSTQYAHMTAELAEPELLSSPTASLIREVVPTTLAGQRYLLIDGAEEILTSNTLQVLSRLGASSEMYEYFSSVGNVPGPLLRPVEPQFVPFVPLEMAEARRYKGKTNEVFTRVLLNAALFAGSYAGEFTERLRVLDPLAGGGTTLFLALAYGYDAFGIELERQDVETTAVFVRQYLENERISYKELDERGRRAGRRYQFEIGPKGNRRYFVLAQGDTREAALHMREIAGGPRFHAIVGDLPYGIQHFGELASWLGAALTEWQKLLLPGGTLALAWNATRIERAEMIELIERSTSLLVRNEPPYTQFAHAVDRVIKKRDIVIAVRAPR
jgi:SAM-dependent methyltransferase